MKTPKHILRQLYQEAYIAQEISDNRQRIQYREDIIAARLEEIEKVLKEAFLCGVFYSESSHKDFILMGSGCAADEWISKTHGDQI